MRFPAGKIGIVLRDQVALELGPDLLPRLLVNDFAARRIDILDALPRSRVDWMGMVTLKRTWGVSIQALLYRARTLGTLDDGAYENAMKTMSRRGWRRGVRR